MDRVLDAIERLPGPVWVVHIALFAVTYAIGIRFVAPNFPDIPGPTFTVIPFFVIAGTHWLRFVTARAMQRIRPALDLEPDAFRELDYRLRVTPPKVAWVIAAVELVYLPLYVFSELEPFGYRQLPAGILIPGLVGWAVGEAFGWVLVFTSVRRLVIIARLHRDLARVELFRQQPLHAFSAITIRTALLLLLLFAYVPLLTLGTEAVTDPYYLGSLLAAAVLAVVIAVVPLTGTHRVLAEAKRDRSMANGHRIQQTLDELDRAVDLGDVAIVEQKQKTLNALLGERDLLSKVPTWPWAPGTIRTFATTILVPIVLLIANRGISRWLG